jgi:hypothetical protein
VELFLELAEALICFIEPTSPESSTDQDCHAFRRRHKSAVQRSVSSDVSNCSALLSKNIRIAFKAINLAEVVILLIFILEVPISILCWDRNSL